MGGAAMRAWREHRGWWHADSFGAGTVKSPALKASRCAREC
ncbi:hypothetical protein ACFPRL_02560 [Pseudoclavibacter helvolus]